MTNVVVDSDRQWGIDGSRRVLPHELGFPLLRELLGESLVFLLVHGKDAPSKLLDGGQYAKQLSSSQRRNLWIVVYGLAPLLGGEAESAFRREAFATDTSRVHFLGFGIPYGQIARGTTERVRRVARTLRSDLEPDWSGLYTPTTGALVECLLVLSLPTEAEARLSLAQLLVTPEHGRKLYAQYCAVSTDVGRAESLLESQFLALASPDASLEVLHLVREELEMVLGLCPD